MSKKAGKCQSNIWQYQNTQHAEGRGPKNYLYLGEMESVNKHIANSSWLRLKKKAEVNKQKDSS